MSDMQGMPAAPPERDLPNHRRIREELLMKIDPEDTRTSVRRRWGLPLGVAAGVAALSVAVVAISNGQGSPKPTLAPALGMGTPATASASPGPSTASAPASPSATPTQGSGSGGGTGTQSAPAGTNKIVYTVTDTTTTPIAAGTAAKLLASCLGSDASAYHVAVAARTPIASSDTDGAVIGVNSSGQYVQCETKGDQAKSADVPPTFINNRLWGTGHIIEYFDSTGEATAQGQLLALGAGHYASDVAKITISYGDNPQEYPAVMADGAFFYASAASPSGTSHSKFPPMGPAPYVHAYNASGKEIYNQYTDPTFAP